MAINNIIDLDAKLALTKTVKIAGKNYDISISDEIDRALSNYANIDVTVQLRDMASKEKVNVFTIIMGKVRKPLIPLLVSFKQNWIK